MTPKLYFCTPGTNEHRKAFWDEIESLGLLPVARNYEQIVTPFGRDRGNDRNWPDERSSDTELAELREWTQWRAQSQLGLYSPRPAEAAFINYEPLRYDERRQVSGNWMLELLSRQLMESEMPALIAMLEGARVATDISLSYYNLPRLTKGRMQLHDYQHLIGERDFYTEHFDHVQVDLYPFGDRRDDLRVQQNLVDHAYRVHEQFEARSIYDLPMFAMLWPRQFTDRDVIKHHTEMSIVMATQRTDHIVLWIECTSERNVELAIERLRDVAPFLLGVGFEAVEEAE